MEIWLTMTILLRSLFDRNAIEHTNTIELKNQRIPSICIIPNWRYIKICEKCTDNPKYKICCDKHNLLKRLWLCFGAFFCHSHAGSDEIKFKEGWSSCCTGFCNLQAITITYASPALNSPPGQCVGFPKNLWPV